jgi:hypothetical protein
MVGGDDVVIDTRGVETGIILEAITRHILQSWRSAIIEDADHGKRFPSFSGVPFAQLRELMIYRDGAAFESWERLGADESNANSMFHLIADPDTMTIVVDDARESSIATVLEEIRQLVHHGLPFGQRQRSAA